MELNLTQSFKRAFERLRVAGTDSGYRHLPGRNGRTRILRVGSGLWEAREALLSLTAATDLHSINCGRELVEGDEILYVAKEAGVAEERARFRRVSRSVSYFTLATAHVSRIGSPGHHGARAVALTHEDGTTSQTTLGTLTLNGCWRRPWTAEILRDGVLAARIVQDERDIENQERYSA